MKTSVALMLLPFMVAGLSAVADDGGEQIPLPCGVQGGLIVHLGCGDGRLTAALGASDRYLAHGMDAGCTYRSRTARSSVLQDSELMKGLLCQ